ncbi:hypothetical protein BJ741DRAFT_627951 [Chytriomyces cf. hyalinus JEL632]|nr:hypothetical protein BJ741DRAFT_627951 [Chytriomyces cf. hyalinus JEL632]
MAELSGVFLYVGFAAIACLMIAATAVRWLRMRRDKQTTLSFWKYLSTITGPNADPPPFEPVAAVQEALPRYSGPDTTTAEQEEDAPFVIVCRGQDALSDGATSPLPPPLYSR